MTTALGVAPDDRGNGLTPLTHRRIIKGLWSNTGVVSGLACSGRADLRYDVAAGMAVCSRGASDGYSEAWWDGGQTPAVKAGDPSNPRIDVVWIRANDLSQGDGSNQVEVGVVSGDAAPSPTAPSLPAGAVELMRFRVPAGATRTIAASRDASVSWAIPYGASLGLLGEAVDTLNGLLECKAREWAYDCSVRVHVPTDRLVELVFTATFLSGDKAHGPVAYRDKSVTWGVAAFQVDGVDVPASGSEWEGANGVWQDHELHCVTTLTAGDHVIRARTGMMGRNDDSLFPYFVYGSINGVEYKGRTLRVWDRGVSR